MMDLLKWFDQYTGPKFLRRDNGAWHCRLAAPLTAIWNPKQLPGEGPAESQGWSVHSPEEAIRIAKLAAGWLGDADGNP